MFGPPVIPVAFHSALVAFIGAIGVVLIIILVIAVIVLVILAVLIVPTILVHHRMFLHRIEFSGRPHMQYATNLNFYPLL